jgi:hypothetical protein
MIIVLVATALLLLSVAAPLLTYGTSLALFGLAHVAYEVRYVDQRFGRRIAPRLLASLLLVLAGVVLVRAARVASVLPADAAIVAELGLGVGLAVAVAPAVGARGLSLACTALAAALLAAGAVAAPALTLLVLALVHNITPLGFLAEALQGPARGRQLAGAALLLVGLPVLVATGLPFELVARAGLFVPEATWLPTGPLFEQLGAYLPRSVHMEPWALHAFSGAVLAQCFHYVAVIGVLPRLGRPGREDGVVRWPAPRGFALLVIAGTAVLLVGFARDFAGARQLYGVAATFHVWLELPVLLLALAGMQRPETPPVTPATA